MDDTDRKLMLLIYEDPRMPLRELAKRLGISRQAAHHHLQVLARAGVFKDIRAEISSHYLDGVPVMLWGRSKALSIPAVLDRLGESEFTVRVTIAGCNELFIFGYLRGISDLSDFVEFVKSGAEIPELTVGLPRYGDGINPIFYDGGYRKEKYRKLSPLDLRIISSLQDNARKPISEIAKNVGLSSKTVRRRIDRMRRDGSMDYNSPWDLPSGEEMITLLYVTLKKDADRVKSARRLLALDPVHLIYLRAFSNLPDFLVGLISSDKMAVIRKVIREVEEDEDVLAVTPSLIYFERSYVPWDVRMVIAGSEESLDPRRRR